MNLSKENFSLMLQLAIVVLLTCLLISLFRGRSSAPDPAAIKAYDLLIEEKERHLQTYRKWKDEEIRRGLERDSLLAVSFINHQKVYEPIYNNLKNVGARFDRIAVNDDSLRAAGKRRYD